MQRSHWIATALVTLWLVPALAQAQDDAPDLAARRVRPAGPRRARSDHPGQHAHPAHHRHSTAGRENILDFVVGDSEYWHLTGAANLAFLKPIGEGVNTNVALVCESGRIYSFLVTERDAPPHLIVRVGADPDHHDADRHGASRLRRALARRRVSAHGRAKPRGRPSRAARSRGADRRHAPGRRRAGQSSFVRPIPRGCSFPISWTTRPRAGRSSSKACGTTGSLRMSDPPPRKRPRSTKTATANRPSSRTTLSKTGSLSSAGLSAPAGSRSAGNAPAGKWTLTIWTNHHAELDPTHRPRCRRVLGRLDHAHRRGAVRPDSRRRVPHQLVFFDGPHRPGIPT